MVNDIKIFLINLFKTRLEFWCIADLTAILLLLQMKNSIFP